MEDVKVILSHNLRILPEYYLGSHLNGFAECLFNRKWIRLLLEERRYCKPFSHHLLKPEEIVTELQLSESISDDWQKYFVQVLPKKDEEVYPLPRISDFDKSTAIHELSFPQFLNYVALSNMKNAWNASFQKYPDHTIVYNWKKGNRMNLEHYNKVLRSALQRLYKCPFIHLSDSVHLEGEGSEEGKVHPNIHPAVCVLEGEAHFFIIMAPSKFSVFHCLNFSPSKLQENETGAIFLIHQLCEVLRAIHDEGLFLGNVPLRNLRLSPDFHLSVIPSISSLLKPPSADNNEEEPSFDHPYESLHPIKKTISFMSFFCDKVKDILQEPQKEEEESGKAKSLVRLTELWAGNEISNFEYLMLLSYFAGHSFDSPLYYPTLPWVRDFTSPTGGWRDLTKSKYRLNKGDQQLDHTYELPDSEGHHDQVAYHIPELFSEVTYYVYKARITSKRILQKYVRQHFVASHYPATIARMYALTPEECIPEFYCDPFIFKSIHNDLPDLGVPSFCSGVDDFIRFHRRSLESNYVSRRLHHWIDLHYGYKLTGSASVRAKNVCLSLVDSHAALSRGGVVQLFSIPHPQKFSPSPFLSKAPPQLKNRRDDGRVLESDLKPRAGTSRMNDTIEVPPNYNPLTALSQLEMLNHFTLNLSGRLPDVDQLKRRGQANSPRELAQISRLNDLKTLACIIMEIFCPLQFKAITSEVALSDRFHHALRVFNGFNRIPKPLHYFVKEIFELDAKESYNFGNISWRGLPPPTAYQILQPLSDVISFPPYFNSLSTFMKEMKRFLSYAEEGLHGTEKCLQKVTQSYILEASNELGRILPELPPEGLRLIMPFVVELFRNPITAVCAAWHLTDLVLRILAPQEAIKTILPHLVKLYEADVFSKEQCKLFSRVYLQQLMARFGLKIFLSHFITPIIEGVGGYKLYSPTPRLSSNLRIKDASSDRLENLPQKSPANVGPHSSSFEILEDKTLDSFLRSPNDVVTDSEMDAETLEGTEEEVRPFLKMSERLGEESDLESIDSLHGEAAYQTSLPSISPSSPLRSFSSDEDLSVEDVDYPRGAIPIVHHTVYDTIGDSKLSRSLPEKLVFHPSNRSPLDRVTPTEVEALKEEALSAEEGECNLSLAQICSAEVVWLSNKLGPLLTAQHLTRNLLRMLTLCYTPESNTLQLLEEIPKELREDISITGKMVVGDKNSARVLFCLSEIVKIYGEQVILVQYLSHVTELVNCCGMKFTSNQEAALIGAMTLLLHLLQRISDSTFMELLQETLIRNAVYPVIRLLSSVKVFFPNGAAVRALLAWRIVDSLYIMARRVGAEMTREKLAPTIMRFFTAFSRVHLGGRSVENELSPTSPDENLEEMKAVFSPELAMLSYIPFCLFLGPRLMEEMLPSHRLLRSLSDEAADSSATHWFQSSNPTDAQIPKKLSQANVAAVTGNRIDIQDSGSCFEQPSSNASIDFRLNALKERGSNGSDAHRHLKGNWLAYWEHEIRRNERDKGLDWKQIRLQSFAGHCSSVKGILTLDSENSFISCSKDRTVRLWSLRSEGDGSAECKAQFVYSGHKKSVFGISFCDPLRLIASCDSTVHIWDPFTGTCLKQLDSLKHSPITVLCRIAAPSTRLIVATTDSTLKVVDLRTYSYCQELKITSSSVGLVRCLTTSGDERLVAVAHSSGVVATLDLRTGQLLATWKPHEGEVLTVKWYEKGTFITSALDQTIAVWSVYDKKLKFSLRGPTEPVHLTQLYESQLLTGTTANRVGTHSPLSPAASFSSTRLRSETLRGVLTAMRVLPLNRQLLIGSDNGSLHLIC